MKALKVSTDNKREVVDFSKAISLDVLSEAVGGFIERVHLPSLGIDMWVNEEGKYAGEIVQNPMATALWVENYGPTDVMVGNVIFTGGANLGGETLGLTDEQLATLLAYEKSVTVPNLNIEDYLRITVTDFDGNPL